MSVTLSGISVEQLSAGSLEIKDQIIDGQFNVNAFLGSYREVLGDGKPMDPGHAQVNWPLSFVDHSDPTELTYAMNGFNDVDWSTRQTFNDAFLAYTFWLAVYPMAVSYQELQVNKAQGNGVANKLAKERSANVLRAGMRRLEKQCLQGGQTGHAACTTLNGVDQPTGLLEAAAFSAQTHSVGGVAKATYNAYPLLLNEYYDFANSINARGKDGIGYVKSQMMVRAPESPMKRVAIATPECHQAFTRLADAKIMVIGDTKTLDAYPIEEVLVGGIRIRPSPYMPTAGSASTARPVSMYWLTPEEQPWVWLADNVFKFDAWEMVRKPQVALINTMYVGGQLCPKGLASAALFERGQTF